MYKLGLFLALVLPVAVFALPLSDAYGLIKIVAALAGVAVLWASCAGSRFRRTGLEAPIAFFVAAFAWSFFFSIDRVVSVIGVTSQPFHGAAALIPALLVFYAVSANSDKWPDGPFVCAGAIAAINGVVCASQLLGLWDEPFNTVGNGRALGTLGSPVFLAAVVAPCLPPVVWLASKRRVWIVPAILGFLALAASHSRGAWVAGAAGLLGLLAASGAIRLPFWRLAGVGALLLALAWPQIAPRLSKSDSGRLLTWGVAVRAGADRPLTGWGPDTFALLNRQFKSPEIVREYGDGIIQASAHNAILQTWATLGLPGVLALLWLIVATWRRLRHESRMDEICNTGRGSAPAFGAFVAILVVAAVNPVPPMAVYLVAAMTASVLRVR